MKKTGENPGKSTPSTEQVKKLSCSDISMEFHIRNGTGKSASHRSVLRKVNFHLKEATIVGLVGKTGVGKTTLGKIMGGLLRPTGGTVLVGDIDLFDCSVDMQRQIRSWIRYVPQNPDAVLFPSTYIKTAFKESIARSDLNAEERRSWQATTMAEPLFNADWMHRCFSDLSLGERRRIINLRSIQSCPRFLIMDEPFNGLDIITKGAMLQLLRTTAAEKKTGVFIISHDVATLESICSEVLRLDDGNLIRSSE